MVDGFDNQRMLRGEAPRSAFLRAWTLYFCSRVHAVPASLGSPAQLLQGELLHSPVHELGDVQGVGLPAVDGIDHAELFDLLASAADTADHRAVQLHLVNLAVEKRVLGRVGVGAVEKLLRAGRDADGTGRAHVLELGLERAVVVEHLNALVAHIGDVDVALGIDGDRVRSIELAGFGTGRAPGLGEPPGLVELGDAGVAVPVGDEDVAGSVPGHIGGLVEIVAGDTGSRAVRRPRPKTPPPARCCRLRRSPQAFGPGS